MGWREPTLTIEIVSIGWRWVTRLHPPSLRLQAMVAWTHELLQNTVTIGACGHRISSLPYEQERESRGRRGRRGGREAGMGGGGGGRDLGHASPSPGPRTDFSDLLLPDRSDLLKFLESLPRVPPAGTKSTTDAWTFGGWDGDTFYLTVLVTLFLLL